MNEQNKSNDDVEEVQDDGEVLRKEYEFTPHALCKYKQRGPYLVCTSCELQHAVFIGIENMMVGEDANGKPIIKRRTFGA